MAYEDEKNKPYNKIAPRILIASADPEVSATIHNSPVATDFEVGAVIAGLEAINTVVKQRFNLLLPDLVLPLIGGLDTLRSLSVNTKSDRSAVIMITTQNDDIDGIVALEMGGED